MEEEAASVDCRWSMRTKEIKGERKRQIDREKY